MSKQAFHRVQCQPGASLATRLSTFILGFSLTPSTPSSWDILVIGSTPPTYTHTHTHPNRPQCVASIISSVVFWESLVIFWFQLTIALCRQTAALDVDRMEIPPRGPESSEMDDENCHFLSWRRGKRNAKTEVTCGARQMPLPRPAISQFHTAGTAGEHTAARCPHRFRGLRVQLASDRRHWEALSLQVGDFPRAA